MRPTCGGARLASTDTTVSRRQRTPACSAPTITLHRQLGAKGGIAQPQLLPFCIASKGMPHLRPSLARAVGCNAPRGPSTYLSRQPWGAAQRYHPLLRIPTRVAAPTPGTQHPYGTRMISASGRNDSRAAMATVLVRRCHCTPREGGGAPSPCLMRRGRHFSGDLRWGNYPG